MERVHRRSTVSGASFDRPPARARSETGDVSWIEDEREKARPPRGTRSPRCRAALGVDSRFEKSRGLGRDAAGSSGVDEAHTAAGARSAARGEQEKVARANRVKPRCCRLQKRPGARERRAASGRRRQCRDTASGEQLAADRQKTRTPRLTRSRAVNSRGSRESQRRACGAKRASDGASRTVSGRLGEVTRFKSAPSFAKRAARVDNPQARSSGRGVSAPSLGR